MLIAVIVYVHYKYNLELSLKKIKHQHLVFDNTTV